MNHPDKNELSDFILGKLPSERAETVEVHLSDCLSCQQTLLNLSACEDTFVNALRGDLPEQLEQGESSLCADGPVMLRDYQLLQRLGRGGMGSVYRARHLKLGRLVAVKVLPSDRMKDRESIARFQREMQAVGKLDHSNIVRAYDAGEVDGQHFLVMELINGVDLARLVAEFGPLEVADACEIIRQAAAGLEHAHRHGLVHRDIKPSNVMIARGSPTIVKVLDLGLARMLSDNDRSLPDESAPLTAPPMESDSSDRPAGFDGSLTTTHQLMGTPDYMSPEQCTNIRQVDIRSDVYSLGATLYKLLTGTAPHSGPQYRKLADKIRGVRDDAPAAMTDYRSDLPADLLGIVDRMLSKDVRERFSSPGEVAQALEPLTVGHRIDRLVNAATTSVDESEAPNIGAHSDPVASVQRNSPKHATVRFVSSAVLSGLLLVALLAFWGPLATMMGLSQQAERTEQRRSIANQSNLPAETINAEANAERVVQQQADPAPQYVYCTTALSALEFSAAGAPALDVEHQQKLSARQKSNHWIWTYAVMDGPGEIYLSPPLKNNQPGAVRLVARATGAQDRTGRLILPDPDTGDLIEVPFTLGKDLWTADDQQTFLETKRDHYAFLTEQNLPGSAWFRFQTQACERELGTQPQDVRFVRAQSSGANVDPTLELLSGATAINENLQLDRVIAAETPSDEMVAVDGIQGITVPEFDWKTINLGDPPPLDPLAALIPFDQHAFLFPTFAGLLSTLEHSQDDGLALITFAQLNLAESDTLEKYQRQRGLPLSNLARLLGPQFIKSVAITGSDPYFDAGTDVAILFEPTSEDALSQLIEAQIALSAKTIQGANNVAGQIDGVSYNGYVTSDRSLCTYQASVRGMVIVTNSLVQLRHLIETAHDQIASLASLEEYHFFRQRYAIADDRQSGLLVVSDATIRRWCGPRWRIAASRRLYASAALAAVHAEHVIAAKVAGRPIVPSVIDQYSAVAGRIFVDQHGVRSSVYGTLDFLTPIVELDLDLVTKAESANYVRWRQSYERSWRNSFDPIAIRFKAAPESWSADVTVMPLRVQSQYQWLVNLTHNTEINSSAIDSHAESVIHWSMSIDKNSVLMSIARSMLSPQLPVPLRTDPLGWMGSTVEFYVDDDPIWTELTLSEFSVFDAFERELPIAISVEVIDRIKLIPFLAALRVFIEQTAPGITDWETRQHNAVTYMRISERQPTGERRSRGVFNTRAVYYVLAGNRLVFSLNESCLQRAIDRASKAVEEAAAPADPAKLIAATSSPTLLGKNIALNLQGRFHTPLQVTMAGANYVELSRQASWKNLPILNEWKRYFPDEDPVELHDRFWHRRLFCRGGGQYRWNPTAQTMESSIFGPPGTVIADDYQLPIPLSDVHTLAFGLTFEQNGVTAKMEMKRQPMPTMATPSPTESTPPPRASQSPD